MTEGPGLGGYPDLQKPGTRMTQAWQHMWTRMLVEVPNQAHKARTLANASRLAIGRKRR